MRRFLALLLCAAAWACGASAVTPADDVVAAADESLQERTAGRIDFSLTASAEGSDPVGFGVKGVYEFGEADLAVLDLTYELVAGEETIESQIVSDGESAVVVAGDEVVEVPQEQARALRVGNGSANAVPTLDLAAWVRDGDVETKGERTEVRGKINAPAFVADLQRVAATVSGERFSEISGDDAKRLESAVTDSAIVLVTAGDDHELRELRATLDFGADVPAELRDALGRYAGATLSLTLKVDDVATPLEVTLPD